jgi:putative ABC transport system substrate-binding protein
MGRRDLVLGIGRLTGSLLGLALVGGCELISRSAPPAKAPVRRVGFIVATNRRSEAQTTAAFLDGLYQAGWIEGQNLVVDWREENENPRLAPVVVDELIRIPVDLIVAEDTEVVRAAAAMTSQIPIVVMDVGSFEAGVINATTSGFSASLSHPGGNITGTFAPQPIVKRLELTKTIFPNLTRVGLLHTYAAGYPTQQNVLDSEAAARSLGMEPVDLPVDASSDGVDLAFRTAAATNVDAIVETTNWTLISQQAEHVVALALNAKLPGMFPSRSYVTAGGLMSYGWNTRTMMSRVVNYVDRILRGSTPGELPIQLPTEFEFVVNATTAQDLGITLPQDALAQVTEWVQ